MKFIDFNKKRAAFYFRIFIFCFSFSILIYLLSFFSTFFSKEEHIGLIFLNLGILVILVFAFTISIIYEIKKYISNISENIKVSIITKILASILFIYYFLSLFFYIKPIINNYKYLKLLNGIDYQKFYGLNYISLSNIIKSPIFLVFYMAVILSLITLVCSFLNKKISNILLITIPVLIIICGAFVPNKNPIDLTIYSSSNYLIPGIQDVIKSEKAIKEKNIILCDQIMFWDYKDYCKETIKNNQRAKDRNYKFLH